MKKIISLFLLFASTFATIAAQEIKSGNPIIDGWYADPEAVILNKQYWIFPTYSAKYKDQVFLDAFSSKDCHQGFLTCAYPDKAPRGS